MWKWRIVYEGNRRPVNLEIEPAAHKETRELFREANAAGTCELGGRIVAAMYVLDLLSEQEDVVLIFGRVSHEIRVRHERFIEEAPPKRG